MPFPPDAAALTEFVFKVHSRCDLACDHCYVYEHADQSWSRRPARMEPAVYRRAAERIAEHAHAHRLPEVSVILHGGEPLLLGHQHMRELLTDLRRIITPVTRLHLGMQTNGILLSEHYCDLLTEFGVRVGVSLDGDRAANDLHRRYRNGNSSHDKVLAGVALLRRPEYRGLYSGLLCTVDVRSDPIRVYEALAAQDPPRLDFLLPHATWEHPPWRPAGDETPYAAWLTAVHDHWSAAGRPIRIRLFESLRAGAGGSTSGSEWVGLDPIGLAVVETDGEWEQADSLKTAFDGAPATGLTVFDHTLDELSATPELARRRTGRAGLSAICQACPVVAQCGGGLFAHRYRDGHFDNPSVYCGDLKGLTAHVNLHASTMLRRELDTDFFPLELVDALASGRDDGDAVTRLAEAQAAITRGLVVKIGRGLGAGDPGADGWTLLTEIEHSCPDAVDHVLGHPYVRSWAADHLARLGAGAAHGSAYLSVIAAAAAIVAEEPTGLTVPVRDGRLYLPTLGTVLLPGSSGHAEIHVGTGSFTVITDSAKVTVRPGAAGGSPHWQPTRVLTARGASVRLEDGDPHRDCHDLPAADRLDDDAALRWAGNFLAAWDAVADEVPWRLGGLESGLRALVPLRPTADGTSEASTARQAFGALAATETDPAALMVLLVHEFQHGKLNALSDICDLVDPSHPARITVGWRPDPRPAEAVLHGIFAHAAVADCWRVRMDRGLAGATDIYQQYRDWTVDAIAALERTGALTPVGDRFLKGLVNSLAGRPS